MIVVLVVGEQVQPRGQKLELDEGWFPRVLSASTSRLATTVPALLTYAPPMCHFLCKDPKQIRKKLLRENHLEAIRLLL